MAELLKGSPVAAKLTEELTLRCEALKSRGITPTLAMLRVGENPGDIAYENGAIKRCEKVGIAVRKIILPETCSQNEITENIRAINADNSVHGCLMFRPLPDRKAERAACYTLDPAKDVDCMTDASLAGVFTWSDTGFPPCTAQACVELLEHYGVALEGKNVAVVGRSLVIGRPVSMMLMNRNATITVCHSKTKNLPEVCRRADIIIAAIGRAKFIGTNFVSEGQVIVDVGINADNDGKMCGDVNYDEVFPVVGAITPVPGGVGTVTTAVLAKHVIEAAEKTTA